MLTPMRHALTATAVMMTIALVSAQNFAIFDEIADSRERAAFRQLWNTSSPQTQQRLAIEFIDAYPRSIVLREAYELAARAYLAAGNLAAALNWAMRSLRLMPENPFLLVLVADTAAKQQDFDLAGTAARDALRYLDHAAPPSPIEPSRWPEVRAPLRATALFVLGRVATARQQYKDAEQSLLASLTLNPNDMEALYTIGIVRMAVRADEGAARAFARVAQADVAMSGAASESLRVLYARSRGAASKSFDAWVASLKWSPPEPPQPVAELNQPGRYAGSAACRECHEQVYRNWKSTGMANMFRPYDPASIIGDFSTHNPVAEGVRAVIDRSKHFIEIQNVRYARLDSIPDRLRHRIEVAAGVRNAAT